MYHCAGGPRGSLMAGDQRHDRRYRVKPMYTAVEARRAGGGHEAEALRGHVYDISVAGVGIELDRPLSPGESVALDLDLPGTQPDVRAAADVVWVRDDEDEPGPRRMALRFTSFGSATDRDRLVEYLRSTAEAPPPE